MRIRTVDKQTIINDIIDLLEDMDVGQLIELMETITEEEE